MLDGLLASMIVNKKDQQYNSCIVIKILVIRTASMIMMIDDPDLEFNIGQEGGNSTWQSGTPT